MKKLFFVVVLAFLSTTALAEEDAKLLHKEIEKMFELTNVSAMTDQIYHHIGGMWQEMISDMNVPKDKEASVQKYFNELETLLHEDLSWEKMKAPLIDVYARVYTLEEVKAINEFYESPVGKKLLEKMPLVINESMQVSQRLVKDMMPKIQALAAELKAETAQ